MSDAVDDIAEVWQPPAYDTQEGIEGYAKTLDGLHRLVGERIEAGYHRGERLKEWVVFGTWRLDTCGNTGRINEPDLRAVCANLPDVVLFQDIWDKGYLPKSELVSTGLTRHDIPPVHVRCGFCEAFWTIRTATDVVKKHDFLKKFSLQEFVGKKLSEVERIFGERNDALYEMQDDVLIRNDHYIDLRPKEKYPESKRNERGWVGANKSRAEFDGTPAIDRKTYVIQGGDDGAFNVWRFYHKECHRRLLRINETKHFEDIFLQAGYENPRLEPIPNGYWKSADAAPWFNVRLQASAPDDVITIGWRKRVIHIDWSKLGFVSAEVFGGEDVTKGYVNKNGDDVPSYSKPDRLTYIHAWGPEKAVDYLRRVRLNINKVRVSS